MPGNAGLPRAPRVNMDTSVLIRRAGEGVWRRGRTINISRSGVLLQTEGLRLEPATPVEVVVALPAYGDLASTRILGSGRIVRTQPPADSESDPVMAAHLETLRVLREEDQAVDLSTVG